ncbi:MAG TPA: hypothetical protein ENN61_02995 [Bacteroidaceae bacterium]|nr:hypothetical protein [Bacteroidaceae bacterium]
MSHKPMEGMVEDGKELVLEKTAKGYDYKHRKFTPYSKRYAKRKGSKLVNMRLSGDMLESIITEVISHDHGRIKVTNKEVIANVHNTGTGKQPQREFMNINKSNLAKLQKKHLDDPIMKILGRA